MENMDGHNRSQSERIVTPSKDRRRVLVVDDTPANIRILNDTLRDEYDISVATSGKQALEMMESQSPPDLILLDIMMPEMDGYDVCLRLKQSERSKHIPVIFVTAMGEIEDEEHGLALGAVDYITKPFSPPIVKARVRNHLNLKHYQDSLEKLVKERTEEIISRLVLAAEARDTDTGLHIRRIQDATALMVSKLGLSYEEADLIGLAATMHDIGKIGVPDHVLLKDGPLNEHEWELMKAHTEIGAKNLEGGTSRLLETARIIALTHHERWDGTGYPCGLKGEDIPLPGRILALVDVFDALMSARPYKEAWPLEKVVSMFREERGRHFDPKLVDIFLESVEEFIGIRHTYSGDDSEIPRRGDHAADLMS